MCSIIMGHFVHQNYQLQIFNIKLNRNKSYNCDIKKQYILVAEWIQSLNEAKGITTHYRFLLRESKNQNKIRWMKERRHKKERKL